jgi:hypothetical protein
MVLVDFDLEDLVLDVFPKSEFILDRSLYNILFPIMDILLFNLSLDL